MAVAIALSFLAGRYHATPWGKHVNEGAVEWPASPWRILRFLVNTWKVRMSEGEGVLMPRVLARLVQPPMFQLPPARSAHTRHYMPLYKPEKRTMVFDTFVVLDPASELVVLWPEAQLSESEEETLRTALNRIGYFGRAESWCIGRLLSASESEKLEPNCMPWEDGINWEQHEPVRVLAPDQDEAIQLNRTADEWPLCAETGRLRAERWSDPPGSKWITYMRRKDCLQGMDIKRREYHLPRFTICRYALSGAVLPRVIETLSIGELTRRFLQGIYGRQNENAWSEVLGGKTNDGKPLKGHKHVFCLAADEDLDGRLDHVTLYAPDGFGTDEQRAMSALRRLRQVGGKPDLGVVMTGLGMVDDYRGLKLLGPAKRWRSVSPFVPVRHAKIRGGKLMESPEAQLALELQRRGLPTPVEVRSVPSLTLKDGRSVRWLEFRTERLTGQGRRGSGTGYGFEVEFAEPLRGPLALGYGCHFGLGLFGVSD